ncbi:hypothetical protein PG984_005583 [Apiospora sp. TS-2023a]
MYPRSIASVVVTAVLALSAAAQSSSSAPAESTSARTTSTGSSAAPPKITSGPEKKMSRECLTEVFDKFMMDRKEPSGALGDAIMSDLIASANFPTSECDLLSKIPATLHAEYFTFESERSEWWKSHRTAFSEWASSCTGTFPGPPNTDYGAVVTPYLTHSAFLDTYNPASATTCKGVTIETSSSEGAAPRQTMAAGAVLAAAAGVYAAAVAI